MRIEFERTGASAERSGEELAEAARLFLTAYAPSTLEWMSGDEGELGFALHPLGPALAIDFRGPRVVVDAETLSVGPGYDAHARDVLSAMSRELGLAPAAGTLAAADAEAACLGYLRDAAARATPDAGPRVIGDFGHHRYPEIALATYLGPRDETWRLGVLADPRDGLDAFPWVRDGAEHLRGRALSLLWHEVRFRPAISEGEEELWESALEDLRAAHRENPRLDYPAEAWTELSELLGGRLRPPASVRSRDPRRAPPGIRGRIGYRRLTVERGVGAGFTVRFPGDLAEDEREDGIWAYDLDRRIHVAGVVADPDAPAEALVHEADPDGEPFPLALPGLEARAAIAAIGEEVELTAIVATRGAFCFLTASAPGRDADFVRAVAASIAHGDRSRG